MSLLEAQMAKIGRWWSFDGSSFHQSHISQLLAQLLDGVRSGIGVVKVLRGGERTPSGRKHFRLLKKRVALGIQLFRVLCYLVVVESFLRRRLQGEVLEPAGAGIGTRVEALLVDHGGGGSHLNLLRAEK